MRMIPTGNFGPYMTEEERRRRQAMLMRGAAGNVNSPYYGRVPDGPSAGGTPMPQAGTTTGMTAGAEGRFAPIPRPTLSRAELEAMNPETAAAESQLARQQAYADRLRTEDAPQGREVGPSNIYVAPNWGENLAYMGSQILGGYMGRQADKKSKEIESTKRDALLRKATYEQKLADWKAQEDARRELKGDYRYETEKEVEQQRRDADEAWKRLEWERLVGNDAEARAARDIETVVDPDVGEPFETLVDAKGNRVYKNGPRAGEPVEINVVDYNTWADNKRLEAAAEAAATDDEITEVADQLDTDLIKYGKDLQKSNLPAVLNSINEVDQLLLGVEGLEIDPVTGEFLNPDQVEVPGTGGLQNLTTFGGVFQFLSGEGPKGAQLRAARSKVKSEILKLMSGAAVTLPEQLRNDISTAMEWTSSDEDFLRNWPAIKRSVMAAKENYDAAYSPMVIEIYNRRQAGDRVTSRQYLEERKAALADMPEGLPPSVRREWPYMTEEQKDAFR